jgi:crotonobetainyl-CoA:carnitine CoA-transferase CaiB-like acyl-CoA transferase
MVTRALAGIRVLDLSRILAGPWATQTLGDLGAEIIKVERPKVGDDTRHWGPPFLKDAAGEATADSAYFLCANRNKLSIAVDFTLAEGQEIIRELARTTDVLVENFKVGGLKAYGLDYDTLKDINPRLIYCSITGFGQDGPYAERAGYDFLMQGMGGLMSVTGLPDGVPGGGPMKVGVALTDILTGLYADIAIFAALRARNETGLGQYIDLGLLDVQVACLANQSMNHLYGGDPKRLGNGHPNTVPYQDFPTSDGHIIIAVGNDRQFHRLCDALDLPELATDPKYRENTGRLKNRDELLPLIRTVTAARRTQDWMAVLEPLGVPCGPINSIAEVFADPQVLARGTQISMSHATGGDIPLVANPIRLSDTPVAYDRPPPTLGQDTRAVLREQLGMTESAIDALMERAVVA